MLKTLLNKCSSNLRHSSRDLIPQSIIKLGQLCQDLTNLSENSMISGESFSNLKMHEHSLKYD